MTLFDYYDDDLELNAHRDDPDTSFDASRSVDKNAGCLEVLRLFAQHPADGLAAWEVSFSLAADYAPHDYWKRISDCTRDGYLEATGERRPSPESNKQHIVRRITISGLKAIR